MRKIKYFIALLLFLAGYIYNGELSMLYFDNFQESYYQSSFAFLHADAENEEIVEDLLDAGKKNELDFFVISSEIKGAFEKEIRIYGTEGSFADLKKRGIEEKEYRSLFNGTCEIHLELFQNVPDLKKIDSCYYVGGKSRYYDMCEFKKELIGSYGGGFPHKYGDEKETWLNLFSVWIVIFSLMLCIQGYETVYYRKENAVRILMGEDIWRSSIINNGMDCFVLILLFISVPLFMGKITNCTFRMSYLIVAFVVFLGIFTLISRIGAHIDFKKDLAGSKSGKSLLTANYILKIITCIMILTVLVGNIVVIEKGVNSMQQRGFFEKHSDYAYYRLSYKVEESMPIWKSDYVNLEFYERFHEKSLQYIDMTKNFDEAYPVIGINENAYEELVEEYPALRERYPGTEREGAYILFPKKIKRNSDEYLFAMAIFDVNYAKQYKEPPELIWYDEDIDLVGVDNRAALTSWYRQNPIIIISRNVVSAEEFNNEDALQYSGQNALSTMYRISETDFRNFCLEFSLTDQIAEKYNVLEVFNHSKAVLTRAMRICLSLSVLLICLDLSLIFFIIKLEYRFNAVELALKKVLGYTLWQRNRKLIGWTFFSIGLCTLCIGLLLWKTEKTVSSELLLIAILMICVEIGIILKKAGNMEKVKLQQVLKGETV